MPPPTALALLTMLTTASAATQPPPTVRLRTATLDGPPPDVAPPAPGTHPHRRRLAAFAPERAPPPAAVDADPRWGPLAGGAQVIVATAPTADGRADAQAAVTALGGQVSAALPDAGLLVLVRADRVTALGRMEGEFGKGRKERGGGARSQGGQQMPCAPF